MNGESTWRKGIYKIEKDLLSVQWSSSDGNFPKEFTKAISLTKIHSIQGDFGTVSGHFIEEVTCVVKEIVAQFNSLGYSKETKIQFIEIVFKKNTERLVQGSEICNAAAKFISSIQDSIKLLELRTKVTWSEIVLSPDETVSSNLTNSPKKLISSV